MMNTTDEKNSSDQQFSESAQAVPVAQENATMTAELPILTDQNKEDFNTLPSGSDHHHRQLQTNNNYNSMNMSFDNQPAKNEFNSIDSASVVQSIGHLLRNARMAKGMSIDEVSRQLRLSVPQIEAIEKEDFERIPGRTFLRGFIRNYAHLVQLDPAPLLQMLPASTRVVSTYERTPFKNKQISFSSNREAPGNHSLIIAVILFVIVLGAYFLFENGGWNKNSDSSIASEETKIEPATASVASVEIQLPLPAIVKNSTDAPVNKSSEITHTARNPENTETAADVKTTTVAIDIKPVIEKSEKTEKTEKIEKTEKAEKAEKIEKKADTAKNIGHLHFTFTADSWVKVVDGSGASIFEQLKKGGSEQMVTGKRPLSIVIGNASGVNLTYNDKEIDISSYKKQGGTARFTLE